MSRDEQPLTMAEVAEHSGLTLSRVRFYEREGLLPAPVHDGRRRRYDPAILAHLQTIGDAQRAGLSLVEIRELLALGA